MTLTPSAPLGPMPAIPDGQRGAGPAAEPRVDGEAIVYRLYDVGYEIDLPRAFSLLAESAPERVRPARGEAQAIEIANPPVRVGLGPETISIAGTPYEVDLSAGLFDFGAISLRARLVAPPALAWNDFSAFADAVGTASAWTELFPLARDRLLNRMVAAVDRPGDAAVSEDYMVFRVNRIVDASGRPCTLSTTEDDQIARLLVGEARPISAGARKELLSQRFSYFDDDLTVLTWHAALVVELVPEDRDVEYILEFANAQLLELRYFDAVLDEEVPRIYEEIAAARRGFHLLGRRYSRLLAALQTRVADATELVERVENSLKVTDDVFLARIYAAALEIFRERAWRHGIDRKLAIVRDAYTMLNAESQARRSEVLEAIIVLLIVIEIVLSLLRV